MQGTAADIIKIAMIRLDKALAGTESRMVLQVHDELIVECEIDTAEEVKMLVEMSMLDAVQNAFPDVCFEVESGVCNSWSEK